MQKKNVILLVLIIVLLNIAVIRYFINKSNFPEPHTQVLEVLSSRPEKAILDSNDTKTERRILENQKIIVSRENAITRSVELVKPSVVSVNVIKTEVVRNEPFHSFFFDDFFRGFLPRQYEREVKSLGSGVIISEDGYIITNSHVVKNASKIKVTLADGSSFDGVLIGNDDVNDIAVVKISGKNLPYAMLGDSDEIIIGEWTIAIGNPFGFLIKDSKPTVTVGVISAIDRNFHISENNKVYKKMIQSDAAINPGNSGGPLVNINGEVIGINTFIFTKSGGSLGIGFAIPVNRVKSITHEIIKYGKIRPIWFGFKVQDITPKIAYNFGLKSSQGVFVSYIEKAGPAEEAGLKRGDIITKINEQVIDNADDAEIAVSDVRVGQELKIEILRNRKKEIKTLPIREYKDSSGSFFKL
ncbi:MAG: trypsin-like peptidase domain-containing protein [Candidatus Cloacimonetes bacterium]|nr:trypsin-like peptidase domain-containing protein [Candidatus Cloacimonadota bacterium]